MLKNADADRCALKRKVFYNVSLFKRSNILNASLYSGFVLFRQKFVVILEILEHLFYSWKILRKIN